MIDYNDDDNNNDDEIKNSDDDNKTTLKARQGRIVDLFGLSTDSIQFSDRAHLLTFQDSTLFYDMANGNSTIKDCSIENKTIALIMKFHGFTN